MINSGPAVEDDPDGIPVPPRIADVLQLVTALLYYGRFLAAAVAHGAAWRGFATVAQFFGTAAVPEIAARIRRGMMRAIALHNVLLQRAQRGRDLVVLAPRQPAVPGGANRSAGAGTKPKPQPGTLPTQAELEAWARRRPVGGAVTDICLDLGLSPGLCCGPFWQHVFDVLQDYRGSATKLMLELCRRQARFENDDGKHPAGLTLPARARDAIRDALGFFIGEPPPDDPFRPSALSVPAASLATGPP
jgi:hypothetical protein